jgi:predicted transglutaminase-like cysteine proteinase
MNIRNWAKYAGLGIAVFAATTAHAESRPFMPHGEMVTPPPGYLDMCQRDGAACASGQTFAALSTAPAFIQPTASVGEARPNFLNGGFLTLPRAQAPTQDADASALAAYAPVIDETLMPAGEMRHFSEVPAAAPVQLMAEAAPAVAAPDVATPVSPLAKGPVPQSLLKLVNGINQAVNREVNKATDFDLYGLLEFWSLPRVIDGKMYGDCEDYALEKRRRLIEAGIPAETLSLAVAVTARGESHAVLVVAMQSGDVVLDNLTPWATPWQDLNYHWVERQVAGGAEWVSIG